MINIKEKIVKEKERIIFLLVLLIFGSPLIYTIYVFTPLNNGYIGQIEEVIQDGGCSNKGCDPVLVMDNGESYTMVSTAKFLDVGQTVILKPSWDQYYYIADNCNLLYDCDFEQGVVLLFNTELWSLFICGLMVIGIDVIKRRIKKKKSQNIFKI